MPTILKGARVCYRGDHCRSDQGPDTVDLSESLTDFALGEEMLDSGLDLMDALVQPGQFAGKISKDLAA